jgi:hypothetical protein
LDYIISSKQPRAVNSAVECHPHTVEVTGSNPVPPTSKFQGLRTLTVTPFSFLLPYCDRFLRPLISLKDLLKIDPSARTLPDISIVFIFHSRYSIHK